MAHDSAPAVTLLNALRGRSARAGAVELLDRGVRWWPLPLQALRHALRLREHTQHVAAGELREVRVAPAAARQLSDDRWILRHVLEASDRLLDAIEVAADADVIGPDDLSNMLNGVGNLADRRRRTRMRRAPRRDLGPNGGCVTGMPPAGVSHGRRKLVVVGVDGLRHEAGHERHHHDATVL